MVNFNGIKNSIGWQKVLSFGVSGNESLKNNTQPSIISSSNLLSLYLDNQAKNNILSSYDISEAQYSKAFDNFDNMKVLDANGNIVQKYEYKKDGSKITEDIFVKLVNGSTVNKMIVNDGNKKSVEIVFKDKNGNVTDTETRTYEKIDEDTAVSVHNDKIYKISGLSGDIINVEYNGQKTQIDLTQKIQNNMENFDGSLSKKEITNEQRKFLASRVKKLSGDLLIKFNEETDKLVMLDYDGYEGFYRNTDGVRKLIISSHVEDDMTFLHELGHAINHLDSGKENNDRWSDDKDFANLRDKEIALFNIFCKKEKTKYNMQKFMNCDYFIKDGLPKELAKKEGADEEFAEITGFMNSMDVSFVNPRTAALLQFMPNSVQIVREKLKNTI